MGKTSEARSRIMRAVKDRDTKPEMTVRRMVHGMGYRYRLHRKDLPGKPDLVFSSRKKVIFVHGCFWHGHNCARGARVPKVNRDYWQEKIRRNKERDKKSRKSLLKDGWNVLEIWECELKNKQAASIKIDSFLNA
jgi:DNA mismatch endonuclease (patch repair protein)